MSASVSMASRQQAIDVSLCKSGHGVSGSASLPAAGFGHRSELTYPPTSHTFSLKPSLTTDLMLKPWVGMMLQ